MGGVKNAQNSRGRREYFNLAITPRRKSRDYQATTPRDKVTCAYLEVRKKKGAKGQGKNIGKESDGEQDGGQNGLHEIGNECQGGGNLARITLLLALRREEEGAEAWETNQRVV